MPEAASELLRQPHGLGTAAAARQSRCHITRPPHICLRCLANGRCRGWRNHHAGSVNHLSKGLAERRQQKSVGMRWRPSRHSPAGQLDQNGYLPRFEVEGILAVLLHGHTVPLVHRSGGRQAGSIGRPSCHNETDGEAGRPEAWVHTATPCPPAPPWSPAAAPGEPAHPFAHPAPKPQPRPP